MERWQSLLLRIQGLVVRHRWSTTFDQQLGRLLFTRLGHPSEADHAACCLFVAPTHCENEKITTPVLRSEHRSTLRFCHLGNLRSPYLPSSRSASSREPLPGPRSPKS